MAQYTDEQIKQALAKIRDKRRRYIKRKGYEAEQMKDIFAKTGLFIQEKDADEIAENVRIVSVEEFKEKFGVHINYGMGMINKILEPDYVKKLNKSYKDNLVIMLNNMGLEEESKKVEEMGYREFMRLDRAGTWDYVQEQYDTYDQISLAEEISGEYNSEEKQKLSKETMEFLGFL